jgi:hypothetical protein
LYDDLKLELPEVRFFHSDEPLGFSGAIRRGVREARHPGVYLLNSDMTLEPDALAHLLEWRRPNVFAIASQIFFTDPKRRREETGWCDLKIEDGRVVTFHADVQDQAVVRGHLFASGGAALYHRSLFRKITAGRDAYAPFYFEDVEWGVRAWRLGYEVLFCPRSMAFHRHRATVSKFYDAAEIERVVERNRMQCQLRNFADSAPRRELLQRVAHADPRTRRELTSLRNVADLARARLSYAAAPCADAPLAWTRQKFYPASQSDAPPARAAKSRRRVLVVSPFAVFPPSHGGAVRMSRLLHELRRDHEVLLLSDEPSLYGPSSHAYFEGLAAVHLVGGRRNDEGKRVDRIRSHSHDTLASELDRIISSYDPDVVQVEYMELGALLERGKRGKPWVLCLHDVLLSKQDCTDEDRVELSLIEQHDAIVTCSPEDAALLARHQAAAFGTAARPVAIVPNGVVVEARSYVSSAGNRAVLFMGPFRYGPNFDGIRRFLERVYPELRRRVPTVELWLAGGHGATDIARRHDVFAKPGVTVLDYTDNPRKLLDRCAVTLNPLLEIRGSSIKLIESLAAGRVCVSTVDGARGFRDEGFRNLISVERIEDMLEPVTWLLRDEAARLALEPPQLDLVGPHDWAHSAARLSDVYRRLESRRAS